MAERIAILPGLAIDADELEFSYVRSSGPGGQNVNKVSTAARLRFNALASRSLSDAVKSRLACLAGGRIDADGVLTIFSQVYRSQARNRQDAIDRLVGLLRAAATPPKKRRKTRPTPASRQRRLRYKIHRTEKKQNRRTPRDD